MPVVKRGVNRLRLGREKYWALSGLPSHSFESGRRSFFTRYVGPGLAYSALMPSHFSSPGRYRA